MGSLITNDLTAGENIVRLGGIGLSPDKEEEDNAADANPADVGKAEANIVRLMTSDQSDQKGETISPLSPSPVTELPPDFDFIASKTDDEKVEYIQSVLARSEDEAIAVISPALRFYGTAGSVVQAYLPLILEVKKHLCRPGRPKVNPTTGERSKTWAEVCEENLHISIRRMQQILASLQEPKLPGKRGTTTRRPSIDRMDYERARQVAAPARSLAEAVVKQGMGDKFPEALEILKLANIPVPGVKLAATIAEVNNEPDWKGILTELAATLEQYGDRLPIPVIKALKSTQELLERNAKSQSMAKSGASTDRHLVPTSPLSGRVKGSHGGTYGSEGAVEANRERPNSSPIAEPPTAATAGTGQPKAVETLGGEPVFPGDWVTTDSSTKYLGRFQGKKGRRFILGWYHKPSKKWCPKPKLTDYVHRRLTAEEVRERFPGALEAWGASQAATPEPALRPSSKAVSGSAAASATDLSTGEPPKGSPFESPSAPGMDEADQERNAQSGELPPSKPMAAAPQDAGPLGVASQDAPQAAAAPSPGAKQGMSEEASRTLSEGAPEPPGDGAGTPTTDAARRRGEKAKHEYPSRDLEIIMNWTKTSCGTAKDIVAQCPGLTEKRVKKVAEMCEQLVAEGRLTATDVPPLRYIGQAGAYFRELRKKGVY